nr:hypothetical protein GCM10020092_094980 [Actinoplanes digitatis]
MQRAGVDDALAAPLVLALLGQVDEVRHDLAGGEEVPERGVQELKAALRPAGVPGGPGLVDEEEAADHELADGQGAVHRVRARRAQVALREQLRYVGVQFGLEDHVAAAVQDGDGDRAEAPPLRLDLLAPPVVGVVPALLVDLPLDEVGEEPFVEVDTADVAAGGLQGVGARVVEREQEQQQRLTRQFAVRQDRLGGQRPQAPAGEPGGVVRVPHLEPGTHLRLVERLQAQHHRFVREARAVGDHRAAGDQHRDRPVEFTLALLEAPDLVEVVGPVHPGGLQQLVEAVQDHHRQRVAGPAGEIGPGDPLAEHLEQGLLDLRLYRGVGGHVAQLDPDDQEVGGGQPGGERPGHRGLARAGLTEHHERGREGVRPGEVCQQETLHVVDRGGPFPPLLGGRQVVGSGHRGPAVRIDVAVAEARQHDVRVRVCGAENRRLQPDPVPPAEPGEHGVDRDRAGDRTQVGELRGQVGDRVAQQGPGRLGLDHA